LLTAGSDDLKAFGLSNAMLSAWPPSASS